MDVVAGIAVNVLEPAIRSTLQFCLSATHAEAQERKKCARSTPRNRGGNRIGGRISEASRSNG